MRIISGKFKGRTFTPPIDPRVTRPTTDLAKEALFNILDNRFEFTDEMHVLDLFAGTGSIAYEFMSRGIGEVTCVETSAPMLRFIRQTAFVLGIKNFLNTESNDAFKWIAQAEGKTYDLIFADPPYAMAAILTLPDLIFKHNLLKSGGQFIVEHDVQHRFDAHPRFVEERNYGKTVFTFFE
jgi:16S rRNA (guanine(966)-N(2))-methyltransferase RsmD